MYCFNYLDISLVGLRRFILQKNILITIYFQKLIAKRSTTLMIADGYDQNEVYDSLCFDHRSRSFKTHGMYK